MPESEKNQRRLKIPGGINAEEYWEQELNKCRSSGLSHAEYCRRNSLNYQVLLYWKRKISTPPLPGSEPGKLIEISSRFKELKIVPESRYPQSPLRLWIGGHCLEVGEGFSSETLFELLRVLRSL